MFHETPTRVILCRIGQVRLWNANIHYHPLLLDAVPGGATRVLDVGCRDGILCARNWFKPACDPSLASMPMLVFSTARGLSGLPAEWVHVDVFEVPLAAVGEFDALFSVAALHHMDAEQGLARFAESSGWQQTTDGPAVRGNLRRYSLVPLPCSGALGTYGAGGVASAGDVIPT